MVKPKKSITLEDLALMVQRGFEQTASKADLRAVEERVGGIEDRLTTIELRFGHLENQFDSLAELLTLMRNDIRVRNDEIATELTELRLRVARLEKKLSARK